MIWICVFLIFLYAVTIFIFVVLRQRIKLFKSTTKQSSISFSIIIPFRNEEENLPTLLKSLAKIDYPLEIFEILLVNDASTDNSLHIVTRFAKEYPSLNIQVLENKRSSQSPKKDAIQTAISLSTNDWIVTTDADCTVLPEWLMTLDKFIIKNDPKMVVMPVAIAKENKLSFLQAYEQLDFLSLMGATIGGFGVGLPFLCNGANLAFQKTAFQNLNGYATHNHIASGDDHFLLEDISRVSGRNVHYLKSHQVITTTTPQQSWVSFISQRIRWASKATGYSFWFSKYMGLLVLTVNIVWSLLVITGILICSYILITQPQQDLAFAKAATLHFIYLILIYKVFIDFILIAREAHFYNRLRYLLWYPLVMLCYPFLSSYIAIKALVTDFEWKGRTYSK